MINEKITNTEKIPTKDEAVAEIGVLMQEANLMGANDSEIPAFMDLTRKVKLGEITPEEGVKQATEIRYGKQDYH